MYNTKYQQHNMKKEVNMLARECDDDRRIDDNWYDISAGRIIF